MLRELLNRLKSGTTPEQDANVVPLAAATLLFEVAWADHQIGQQELAHIRSALIDQFALDGATVDEIVKESRAHHEQSVGIYRFTRTLTEAWDEPARFDLVVQLWRLALSDDELHKFEEHTIRKIAELLYVSHPRFIEAKLKAKRDASGHPV